MARLRRIEAWTELQCRSGTRQAFARDVLAAEVVERFPTSDYALTVTVPHTDNLVAMIAERDVLRVVLDDETWSEWRVAEVSDVHETDRGKVVEYRAVSIAQDLGTDAIVQRVEQDGAVRLDFEALALTPAQHLDHFLLTSLSAAGAAHWVRGTIETTAPMDMVYSRTSPLQALLALAEKTATEFRVRPVGTTQYAIDLLGAVGGAAPMADIRMTKNLRAFRRTRATEELVTRAHPTGVAVESVHATMRHHRWLVTGIAATVVTLADELGGPGPILEDDQLNSLRLFNQCGVKVGVVLDTLVATQQVQLDTVAGLVVGAFVTFRLDDAGTELTYLEAPSGIASYGRVAKSLDVPDVGEVANLLRNPAMRLWSGPTNVPPDFWCTVLSDGTTVCLDPAASSGWGAYYGMNYGGA